MGGLIKYIVYYVKSIMESSRDWMESVLGEDEVGGQGRKRNGMFE